MPPRVPLPTVAWVFLRLGATAFGGPAAHVGLMEEEIVRRRGWLTQADFLDLLGAAHLIPGPTSSELAMHVGRRVAGRPGLVVAGVGFILPAALLVTALAWAYQRYGSLDAAKQILQGVKPVVIAVIAQALVSLGRSALTSPLLVIVAVLSAVVAALGAHELAVLAGAGLFVIIVRRRPRSAASIAPFGLVAMPAISPSVSLPTLFWVFLKTGALLFGSGYLLVAYLRADLVERHKLLAEEQLLDAVAVGQVTPGPVTTTATFIGYLLGGPAGAVVATVAIFLPAFVYVAVSAPLVPRLRRSPTTAAVLDGVNAASLALMAVAGAHLAVRSLTDMPSVVLAVGCAALLVRWKVNSTWLIAAGLAFGVGRWLVG
jgi:chromate transporter